MADQTHLQTADWQPRSPETQADQTAAYDRMRRSCPVAYDPTLGYTVFRHHDVMAILHDTEHYTNRVSDRHIAVPSGMDAPEHTAFRKINDKYYTRERMAAFEPACRRIIRTLVAELPRRQNTDIMHPFARDYAVRIQNAFLGWPESLEQPLNDWIEKNRRATLRRDHTETAEIAVEFDGYIRALLDERRGKPVADITGELMHDTVELPNGSRPMTEAELVSLLRNWTVGELSTVSASVGIIVKFLAMHPAEQQRLRSRPNQIPAAVEEIMRLDDPLVSNRRKTKTQVEIGGRTIPAGSPITLNWVSANRDETVFPDAAAYRPERDQSQNLVYGSGIHACPGAPLARMELRILAEELLSATSIIRPAPDVPPDEPFWQNAVYPVSGYSSVRVWLE